MSSEFWVDQSEKVIPFESVYELGREIGRGATAVVYECRKHGSSDIWAVKVLPKRTTRKFVTAEIGVLLHVNHEHIIRLKEVYETRKEIYMVLEMVTGGELFDRIVLRTYYSEMDAAECVRQVLEGLKHLHEMDVIHRDIKPENLLYENESDEAKIKIADFGLSKICSADVQTQTVCGTPGYCAPELLLGQSYDTAVDMWSVGVVTFILLCGYEPFYSDDERQMYRAILRADFDFDPQWWSDISKNAKDFVCRLLTIDPRKRLTAAQALRHPWVVGLATKEEHLEPAQNALKEFNAKRKLRVAAEALLASRHFILAGMRAAAAVATAGNGAERTGTGADFEDQQMDVQCGCPDEIVDVY
ncbi:hypothetical protein BOX15_Mlig010384g1 [Macrostomum lignano]|uniref:Protein kinase domain-containing protein n=2 Tax=Macrostomum lignano TaxID=282301 RepID=A0A1I8G6T2_9PLAT|nr:hypothetical protein BOX15_Mlig010384g1 [Macrostomum lignano]